MVMKTWSHITNHNDEFATLLTNDSKVLDHNQETIVNDHMVKMVNDAYQYYNENPDVNCENDQVESMEEKMISINI